MKSLIVYHADGRWFGSEVNWRRSGSGTFRETSPMEVPQGREAIERFAMDNHYAIEWLGTFPEAEGGPERSEAGAGASSRGG